MSKVSNAEAHSSYKVWLIYHFRAIERILPALRGKKEHAWVAPAALMLLVLFVSISVGIYIDGYGIHPPKQFTGVCPPPAQVRGDNCLLLTTTTIISGTQTVTRTITQPAGHVLTNQTGG